MNRKAVEGSQKADQLKRRRWEQQRINSPPKRSPRKMLIQAKPSIVKKILNDSEPLIKEVPIVEYQKPKRDCVKRSQTPKALPDVPVKTRPTRKVTNKASPKESGKKKVEPRTSQRRVSPRKKEADSSVEEIIMDSENKPELEVKAVIQKKCKSQHYYLYISKHFHDKVKLMAGEKYN